MSTEHSMEEATGVTTEHTAMEDVATEKGKGKAIQEHTEREEDTSDEELNDESQEPEEDDLAEIDTSNIISGSRTRGKNIDWTVVGQDTMEEDDDDDDDEEYHAPVEDDDDAMKD